MTNTPQIICRDRKCSKEFTPQYRNGVLVSHYCPDTRYEQALAKRREQMNVSRKNSLKSPEIANNSSTRKSRTTEKSEKSIKAELDRVFSLFIRQRDADENGNITCISSGKIIPWKKSDCGHYINRKHMSTRYDEINCNAQSRSDNRFDEGNMSGYRQGLIKKYGLKEVEELEIRKFNTSNLGKAEMKILIGIYKNKIDLLNLS